MRHRGEFLIAQPNLGEPLMCRGDRQFLLPVPVSVAIEIAAQRSDRFSKPLEGVGPQRWRQGRIIASLNGALGPFGQNHKIHPVAIAGTITLRLAASDQNFGCHCTGESEHSDLNLRMAAFTNLSCASGILDESMLRRNDLQSDFRKAP